MSKGTTSYRIVKENALHFLTFSTVNWIDVFSEFIKDRTYLT
ncbi:MAG: hypothetical protein QMC21_04525 [Flavobacteriales bacterium]